MRVHILLLLPVGYCVVALALPSGEKPISNLQLLTRNLRITPPPLHSIPDSRLDNIEVVKELVKVLQRYLKDNGEDGISEVDGLLMKQIDEDDDSGEQSDDEGDEDMLPSIQPMLPLVERDQDRSDDAREYNRNVLLSHMQGQFKHRAQNRYQLQPRAQNKNLLLSQSQGYEQDSQQQLQEYLKALLDAELRDDDEQYHSAEPQNKLLDQHKHDSDELQHLGVPDISQVYIHEFQPSHSMKDHVRQLPPELQERVALQAHVQDEKGCAWCALLRDAGAGVPSSIAKQKVETGKDSPTVLPVAWFRPVNGRKWMVVHEDYPGMMQQMMNIALNHREAKKFRAQTSGLNEDH